MHSRIGSRFVLGVGLTTAAVIGLMTWVIIRAHTAQLLFERTRSATQLSEAMRQATRSDMMENRRESLHRQIQTLGDLQREGIRKVRVFNKEGRIMFSSEEREIGTTVNMRAEACHACHAEGRPLEKLGMTQRTRIFPGGDGTRVLGTITPIPNEPSCSTADCHAHQPQQRILGVLDVNVSMAEADQEIVRSRRIMIILAITAIVASSLMLTWLNQRLVIKPVASLVEGTRRVADGELGTSIPVTGNHEIGDLARAFNSMTQRLTETQRQLTHADKLASVGRLAAGVAHEINNPLTGVLSYASLLQRRFKDDEEANADIEVVVRETKRCREIVRRLLDFARPTPPNRHPTDLNAIVLHTASVLETQLELSGVTLAMNLAPDLPPGFLDGNQIEQVLINLLLNAADAQSAQGGEIHVRTSCPQSSELLLEVQDSGHGIPADKLGHIFEPFYSTKGNQGTGLGLSVTWGIIQSHNGSIDVESEPDHGTTFRVRLPLAENAAQPMLSMSPDSEEHP